MSTFAWTVDAWLTRILTLLSIIICIYIIKIDLKSKQIQQREQPAIATSYNSKWLNFWSLTTMILFTIQLFMNLLLKIPFLCEYSFRFISLFWSLAQCTILMYMVNRLQFSFSTQQIHNKYGYNKCTFYILYFFISIAILYTLSIEWMAFDVITLSHYNGCDVIFKGTTYLNITRILYSILVILHIIVLWMYIWKIFQFRCKTKFMDHR